MSDTPERRNEPDRRGKLVLELRMHGPDDNGPTQMISQARLAYLLQVEAEWKTLTGRETVAEIESGQDKVA